MPYYFLYTVIADVLRRPVEIKILTEILVIRVGFNTNLIPKDAEKFY